MGLAPSGNVELVKWVLKLKPEISARDVRGNTAMVMTGNTSERETSNGKQIIELLLNKGATINEMNYASQTALTLAIMNQNLELIEYLIERGAIINKNVDFSIPTSREITKYITKQVSKQTPIMNQSIMDMMRMNQRRTGQIHATQQKKIFDDKEAAIAQAAADKLAAAEAKQRQAEEDARLRAEEARVRAEEERIRAEEERIRAEEERDRQQFQEAREREAREAARAKAREDIDEAKGNAEEAEKLKNKKQTYEQQRLRRQAVGLQRRYNPQPIDRGTTLEDIKGEMERRINEADRINNDDNDKNTLILGLDPNATRPQILKKYKEMISIVHPDKWPDASENDNHLLNEYSKRINQAKTDLDLEIQLFKGGKKSRKRRKRRKRGIRRSRKYL
jgi:hypothetical protein